MAWTITENGNRLDVAIDGRFVAAVAPAARDEIIREGSDPLFGARPLKRYIQSKVESLLARHIIAASPKEGSTLTVDADGDNSVQFAPESSEYSSVTPDMFARFTYRCVNTTDALA